MYGLDDLPSLEEFGDQLEHRAARDARRAGWWTRRPGGSLLIASVLCVGLATSAAAGTLVALRATVIPGPRAAAVAPEMRVQSRTARVAALKAADPGGGPAWTVRSVRSLTGEVCLTVGQRRGAEFGLVGLDGRFRVLSPGIVDGCTLPGGSGLTLSGARVLDGARRQGVRTIVYGLVGRDVRRVELRTGTMTRPLLVDGGRFLAVVRGYPEDRPLRVVAVTAGKRQEQDFGASPRLSPQSGGIPALKLNAYVVDNALDTDCVGVGPARESGPLGRGGNACGRHGTPFGLVKRVARGKDGWGALPSRTLAFGTWPASGPRLRRVTVIADGRQRRARILRGRSFLAVLPSGDPARTRVVIVDVAGTRTTFTRSLGLVKDPLG